MPSRGHPSPAARPARPAEGSGEREAPEGKPPMREDETMTKVKILDRLPDSVVGLIIRKCDGCPFFDDGGGYEYAIECHAGAKLSGDGIGDTDIPKDCPLTDVDDTLREKNED